jgi:hypothetical protein
VLLERFDTGELTLTTVSLLTPHLAPDNHQHLVEAARNKSKRDVERLVTTLRPQPPVASAIRKLPQPVVDGHAAADAALLRPAAGTMSAAVPDVTPDAAMNASPTSVEAVRDAPSGMFALSFAAVARSRVPQVNAKMSGR